MTRFCRKLVAALSVGLLLFLQLAVSAYACAAPMPVNVDMPPAATMKAGEPSDRSEQPPPNLCELHCLQSSQSVDTQPHAAPLSPVLPLILAADPPDVRTPAGRDLRLAGRATPVDPPPLVRFGVLRL